MNAETTIAFTKEAVGEGRTWKSEEKLSSSCLRTGMETGGELPADIAHDLAIPCGGLTEGGEAMQQTFLQPRWHADREGQLAVRAG